MKPGGPDEVAPVWENLENKLMVRKYYDNNRLSHSAGFSANDFIAASRMPLTNEAASSVENFFASSTASFSTTLGGVPIVRNSAMARRRIARSMAGMRSIRQFFACVEMIGSSSAARAAAFSKS